MNAKLIVEGKEFDIEILDPKLQELLVPKVKKTGYERVKNGEEYYWSEDDGLSDCAKEEFDSIDNGTYKCANYYSDKTIAENNARADKLMRQLRRFAVEHRKEKVNYIHGAYEILYDYGDKSLNVDMIQYDKSFGVIPFDEEKVAKLAIDTFRNELIWYFTEYKDSL